MNRPALGILPPSDTKELLENTLLKVSLKKLPGITFFWGITKLLYDFSMIQ